MKVIAQVRMSGLKELFSLFVLTTKRNFIND